MRMMIKSITTITVAAAFALAWGTLASHPTAQTRKFYDDDPLLVDVESQQATVVQRAPDSQIYNLLLNQFGEPGDRDERAAQNTNTIDAVPDSSWFTNRLGTREMTADEVTRGPDASDGPAPGKWTIVASKTEGLSPGFRMRDSAGQVWFVKFDPPGWLDMATGADVVGAKLLYALGYNTPENHIAYLRKDDLIVGETAKLTPPLFPERRMVAGDVDALLARAARDADGRYRVIVSKALPGKILGGFRYYGTRPDDPNDLVPHEHRRELRGLRVFAAWMNHTDTKSLNSMDTVLTEQGRTRVKHYLLDFSSTLGSGSIGPHFYPDGWEYFIDGPPVLQTMVTFGFNIRPWLRVPYQETAAVGRFESARFDPDAWKPRVPNAAFLRAQAADLFWGARTLMAFSDDLIRAAVKSGEYRNPRDAEAIARVLIERRDRIGRAWLTVVNPIVSPALDERDVLTFANVAVDRGAAQAPKGYEVRWSRYDNGTGESSPLGEGTTTSTSIALSGAPHEAGAFVRIQARAIEPVHASWREPVAIYFRRVENRWKLVGFERARRDQN